MNLTPQQKAWFKGFEVAIGGAIASACLQTFTSHVPHTKAEWMQFGAIILGSAYTAVKLYMAQSPIQDVLVTHTDTEKLTEGDKSLERTRVTSSLIPGPVDGTQAIAETKQVASEATASSPPCEPPAQ